MLKIIFCGISGKMGHATYQIIKDNKNFEIVAGVDAINDGSFPFDVFKSFKDIKVKADVIIDFSRPETLDDMLEYALLNNLKLVIATTGYSKEQEDKILKASKKIAILKASNMSMGVTLLNVLAAQAAAFLQDDFDIEITEVHHNQKVDAPSGTALTLANAVKEALNGDANFVYSRYGKDCKRQKKDIGIHAIRGGSVVGKHDISFFGDNETITISHEASNRSIFAKGALKACLFLKDKKSGLYSMKDLIQ